MKKVVPIATLFLSVLFGTVLCFSASNTYEHKIEVDNMVFEWKLDKEMIHIRLAAKTTGWVGIGFNPTRDMKDANFIIGYVKKEKVKVTDHFGTTTRQHEKDKKIGGTKDITGITGKEEAGVTEIGFTIPLNSGDPKDQPISIDHETRILLAYGSGRDSFRPGAAAAPRC